MFVCFVSSLMLIILMVGIEELVFIVCMISFTQYGTVQKKGLFIVTRQIKSLYKYRKYCYMISNITFVSEDLFSVGECNEYMSNLHHTFVSVVLFFSKISI